MGSRQILAQEEWEKEIKEREQGKDLWQHLFTMVEKRCNYPQIQVLENLVLTLAKN